MSNIEEKVEGSVGQESEALSAEVETEVKVDEVQRTKKLKKREDCLALLLKIVRSNGESLPYGEVNEDLINGMVKEIAGIRPLTISVLNDQDALLEFDLDVIVTSVCRVMQGIRRWGEKEIEICCMAGTKEHLVAIEKSREEFRMRQEELDLEKGKLIEEEKVIKQRLQQQNSDLQLEFQQQKDKMDQLAVKISQQLEELMSTRDEFLQGDKPKKKTGNKLTKPPEFPKFSGEEPMPKDECGIETFLFQVKGARRDVTDQAVRSALISAVRGGASGYLEYIGLDSPLDDLIQKLKERYSTIAPHDTLVCQFHQLVQDKREAIRDFAGRIEKVFRRLHTQNPERYLGETLLKDRLFYGMHQHLKDSLRYLYDQEGTDYNGLLKAAHAAEIDSQKNTVVRAKAIIKKTSKDDTSAGNRAAEPKLKDVAKGLDQLLGIVKANQVKVKKKWKSKSLPATPRKTREPEITAAGPFHGDHKPLQCWRCGGWGHTSRDCPSPGNLNWREFRGAADPPKPVRGQPRQQ